MDETKKLKVDMEELCLAMDDSSYEHQFYLDLETGEIEYVSDYMDKEEAEKIRAKIDENIDRYEPIPKAESHEGYQDMVDFIDTVEKKD